MEKDTVINLDDYRRERWLVQLQTARAAGQIAVFNAPQATEAEVINFPQRTPNNVA